MLENFLTVVEKTPRPLSLFSSKKLHINCIPKQIPNTGCFKVGISVSNLFSCNAFKAGMALPTPGKITLSDSSIFFVLLVKIALMPIRSSAN